MTTEPLTPREALKAYLNDRFGYRGPDDGSDPDDFDDDADAILATLDAARKASPPVTNLRAASCPDCTPTVVEVRHEDGCGWAAEDLDAARKASPPLREALAARNCKAGHPMGGDAAFSIELDMLEAEAVAALRATDAPVAEGLLVRLALDMVGNWGSQVHRRSLLAEASRLAALATPEPDA